MTTTSPAVADPRSTAEPLWPLARIQAARYARHPLYLIGTALVALTSISTVNDAGGDKFSEAGIAPAFLLGVLGLIVAYRLTATEDRAAALLGSAPVPATTRTLALCAACLVPAATALVWFVFRCIVFVAVPPPAETVAISGGWVPTIALAFGGSVIAALGGPLLGVAVGRWWRMPGAGVTAAIALTAVCTVLLSWAMTPAMDGVRSVQAAATALPYAIYVLADSIDGVDVIRGVRDGSPLGHAVYCLALCGLAVWAAVMKDAVGSVRDRWIRIGGALGVAAVISYLWALIG